MFKRPTVSLAALVLLAAGASAQEGPVPDKAANDAKPAQPSASDKAAEPQWPKHIEKKLYAEDIRGKPAPEFVIESVIGGKKPERKGKVVLIDFWATWCPPCRELIPELNEFQDKFKDDLVVIGVSGEKPETVEKFMKDHKFRYTSAIDTQERMSKAIKVEGIPHVLIISTDGIVRWQGFPLAEEEPLTADIIKQIIDADPGVKERREKDAKADKNKADKPSPDSNAKPPR